MMSGATATVAARAWRDRADAVRRAAADGIATLRRTYLDAARAASGTGAASGNERRDA